MTPERWQQIKQLCHAALERERPRARRLPRRGLRRRRIVASRGRSSVGARGGGRTFYRRSAVEVAAKEMAMDSGPSLVGKQVGHYQLLSLLGAGGMGEVYLARDTRLDRTVALKILPASVASDEDRMRRFVREAKAASALNHPNVATIHDVGEADGMSFIVMENVAGQTLASMIDDHPFEPDEIIHIGLQVADALGEAHGKGITHRDIKSANIMLTPRGRVKVLDFGLAKIARPEGEPASEIATALSTTPGLVMGTVPYMSPEQVLGREVDHRSDIFSLGVVLYQMATGRLPFVGASVGETIDNILHAQPGPIHFGNREASAEFEGIVGKCLEKDRDWRYQSAVELAVDLRNLKRDSNTMAAALERVPHRSSQRRRVVLTALALAGLAVGVVAITGRFWGPTAIGPRLSSGGPASTNPEANRYYENAMQLKVTNDLPKTRLMLERALEVDPHFAEARAWYGFTNWLMLDQGYSNDSTLLYKAEEEMRRAAQDDPNLARAHAGFAAIYLMQGRKELIPAEVDQALKSHPEDEDALHWLMLYHLYGGEYAAAQEIAQQVLQRIPLFFPNRMMLGEMLRQQGDLAGAIREQERILEQNPQNLYALGYLARAVHGCRRPGQGPSDAGQQSPRGSTKLSYASNVGDSAGAGTSRAGSPERDG